MKTLNLITIASMLYMHLSAGNGGSISKDHLVKYCAKISDGRLVVMHEGKVLITDATLVNGTVIKANGTIVKKGHRKVMLKEGECVDMNGAIMEENSKPAK